MDDMSGMSRERSERVSKFIDERFAEYGSGIRLAFKYKRTSSKGTRQDVFRCRGLEKFGALDRLWAACRKMIAPIRSKHG